MTKPYPFQKECVLWTEAHDGRILNADDMGLGKTFETLLYIKRNPKKTLPAVVVCPAIAKYSWQNEIRHHIGMRSEVLEGRKAATRRGFARIPPITILNYDIQEAWLPYIRGYIKPKLIVLDEIHNLNNPEAQRTIFAKELCRGIKRVIGLSGTPINNQVFDLWPILTILWPQRYPDTIKDRLDFAEEFCYPKYAQGKWSFKGGKNLGKLNRILKKRGMIRRKKIDVLDQLPAKTRTVIPIDLKNMKEYTSAERDLISWIDQKYGRHKAIKAQHGQARARVGYLMKLAAKLKFKSVIRWIEDFLETTDQKLLVGVKHIAALKTLHRKFPNSVVIYGAVSGKKRQLAIDQFQTNKKVRLLIGQHKAAGVAATLTAGSYGLMAEMWWNPTTLVQFEDRLWRIGQKRAVQWFYPVARNTIEERLFQVLESKMDIISEAIDGKANVDFNVFSQLVQAIRKAA